MNDDSYQKQADVIGPPLHDLIPTPGRHTVTEIIAAAHARNLRHLRAYVQAARIHWENDTDCPAGNACPGPGVDHALDARDNSMPNYFVTLIYTAIAAIADRDDRLADLEVKVMQMDVELMDAQGRLANAQEQLDAVERWPADGRPELGNAS